MKDLYPGTDFKNSPMGERLRSLMEQEGLPYNSPTMSFNTRMAQELAKWADGQPQRKDLHSALYRACFVEVRKSLPIE